MRSELQNLSKLTTEEREALLRAAKDTSHYGGGVVEEPVREVAVALRLAYRTTGRLYPDVYKMMR